MEKEAREKCLQLVMIIVTSPAGRYVNTEKHYYLEITNVVDKMNEEPAERVSYAQKSLIICRLVPDTDGVCKIGHLTSELQAVVNDNLP